jgi:hypothetical protein
MHDLPDCHSHPASPISGMPLGQSRATLTSHRQCAKIFALQLGSEYGGRGNELVNIQRRLMSVRHHRLA